MCGEHDRIVGVVAIVPGSSPHVRGALLRLGFSRECRGIIPACAGSTRLRDNSNSTPRDHPRMCGEHGIRLWYSGDASGSSPHVRGAPEGVCVAAGHGGIIPACAGSTYNPTDATFRAGDHPRMCGEHGVHIDNVVASPGSSPHVRGAHTSKTLRTAHVGIIPACAGSTCPPYCKIRKNWDHPRMCGEHRRDHETVDTLAGSSPHVRGARGATLVGSGCRGIIPACAGSTTPPISVTDPSAGSSPHVRGALRVLRQHGDAAGIIPACAGSTCRIRSPLPRLRDHPRMCGEHEDTCHQVWQRVGSSPHVRGAHFENSIIPRKRKDNWLFSIQFRFENFLAFRYLLALLHPFLGVPTKDPSFASLGRLINCNPSQSTGDQSAPYTLKAICCSFLAE